MEDRRSSRTGKILNIELDTPPGYVYTNGEIVSGRVTLRSPSDEDVYNIVLQLTGTGRSYVALAGNNYQQVGLPDMRAGQVFFDLHQQLYQGTYKLRKDVTYEWPFKMRFPDSKYLLPSGAHGIDQMMTNGDTDIDYELKVSRATSPEQAKALLEKAAKGHEAGLKSKIRGFGASTTSLDLNFLPSRPRYIPSNLKPTREVWALPVRTADDQNAPTSHPSKFNLKSIFKSSPRISYTVRVDLPQNFVQYEHLPAFIRVIQKFGEPCSPGPIIVEKVEFIVSMRVRNKAQGYVGENLEKVTVLKLENPGIVITDSGKYDIGGKYSTRTAMWPTFNSDVVETRHTLRAHVTLDASGKKFKDIFALTDCKIYPNRVTPSPLNQDYSCTFSSQPSPFPYTTDNNTDEIIMPHKEYIDAFFAISRLLTEKKIYPQVVNPLDTSAVLSLILPGQNSFRSKPHTLIPESSQLPGSLALPDPFIEDQRCLSRILEIGTGLKSTTSQPSTNRGFVYRYGGEKSASQVRLEFSATKTATSSFPPPSYTNSPASQSSTQRPLPHDFLTLPKILTHLLHALAISDPSAAELHDTNALTISNVLHLCEEYSAQIRPVSASILTSDAQAAVSKYPELRKPLVELAGMASAVFGEEEDDEPKPRVLTKEEAKFEKRKELANRVGYWSSTAQKRDQIYGSN